MATAPLLRRAAALGALLALAGALYLGILTPFLAALAQREDALAQMRQWTARYRAIADTAADLEREFRTLPPPDAPIESFLGGVRHSDSLILLQDRIKEVTQAHGSSLRSLRILDLAAADGFRRVGVRVQLQTTNSGLAAIAHSLEAGPPYLFLDRLEIQAKTASDRAVGEPGLEVGADIVGFMAGATP